MNNTITRIMMIMVIALAFSTAILGQKVVDFQQSPELSALEVQKLVESYRNKDVKVLKANFAAVNPDMPVKEALKGLPVAWQSIMRTSAQIGETRLWSMGEKAKKIAGAGNYEFVYLENMAPLAASDSNCLMIVTSGMLKLTENNESGLMGVMIHEFAHALFVDRTLAARQKFNAAVRIKDWAAADKARTQLAIIEIECDLVAGKILLASGRKINGFAQFQIDLAEMEKFLRLPPPPVQWYPEASLRRNALLNMAALDGEIATK